MIDTCREIPKYGLLLLVVMARADRLRNGDERQSLTDLLGAAGFGDAVQIIGPEKHWTAPAPYRDEMGGDLATMIYVYGRGEIADLIALKRRAMQLERETATERGRSLNINAAFAVPTGVVAVSHKPKPGRLRLADDAFAQWVLCRETLGSALLPAPPRFSEYTVPDRVRAFERLCNEAAELRSETVVPAEPSSDRDRPLKNFGDFLKRLREEAGVPTQKAAVQMLRDRHVSISQALLAQYETGKVADPRRDVLFALSDLYGVDRMSMLLPLIEEKYALGTTELQRERLNVWRAALTRFDTVGEVTDLETDQLRAKATIVSQFEILGIDGMANWQRCFPNLELFWVAAPRFLDDTKDEIFNAVVYNLQRGIRITYFVPNDAYHEPGRFWQFTQTLRRLCDEKNLGALYDQVVGVPLSDDDLKKLTADVVIANPHRIHDAVAFETVRKGDWPDFGRRLTKTELELTLNQLNEFVRRSRVADAATPGRTLRLVDKGTI